MNRYKLYNTLEYIIVGVMILILFFNQKGNIMAYITIYLLITFFLILFLQNKKYRTIKVEYYIENDKKEPTFHDYKLKRSILIEPRDLVNIPFNIEYQALLHTNNNNAKILFLNRRIELLKSLLKDFEKQCD